MPELPEILHLSEQMKGELIGKTIIDIDVLQEKCLNVNIREFTSRASNTIIQSISSLGKWIFIELNNYEKLALSLGMGGDVIYHEDSTLQRKYHIKIIFSDETCITIRFWWFGYLYIAKIEEESYGKHVSTLGISPLDKEHFTYEHFDNLLWNKRASVKAFLLDQKNVAGIGNVYVQDILFRAKLHPARKSNTLSEQEKRLLYNVIREELETAVKLGGIRQERDLYNKPGKKQHFLVGYKEGKPCPICGTKICKIKVANVASYICKQCQK